MRLTVSEQSDVHVGGRTTQVGDTLSPGQARALVEVGDRIGARVASWQGPSQLRIQQFVGIVRVGDLELEILPKLDGLPEPAQVRRNLLAMLAVTLDLEVQASGLVGFLATPEPFICALGRLYCHRLFEAVRRGLRQDYVLHHDLLPHVRGKIDWASQSRSQATMRLEFSCVFDERSEDTPLNRALKAALLLAGRLLEGARDVSVVTELRHAMGGVSDACPAPQQLQRLRTDRTNHHLKPLLALAKLLLGNRNPDLSRPAQANQGTYALVWDMNVLFEEYVGRLLKGVLNRKGLGVDLQEDACAYLAREKGARHNVFLLKPDILVRHGRKPQAVADTKWKRLTAQQANLGVSGPDVYQVLAYAHRYQTERAVLVYPHHPAVGLPGIQREFLTHGAGATQVCIRVVTVDLARLDSIPSQLEQAFLSDHQALAV